MNKIKSFVSKLQSRLDNISVEKTKNWWERYLRHVIEFRGVNLVQIRDQLRELYEQEGIEELDPGTRLKIALAFFPEKYAEDKLAGILFLQEFIQSNIGWKPLLKEFAPLFDKGYIYDWNVCDWFCVRILGPMIKENGLKCAEAITAWNVAENVWRARASLVAFAYLTKEEEFSPLFLDSCSKLIIREERFAKTAVGWILREYSRSAETEVIDFIGKYGGSFSKESLNNSIKYFSPEEKKKYRKVLKP